MKKLFKEKENADRIINSIKQGTEDSKLRENTSMELYQKMQSPVTSEIEKLGKKMEEVSLPFTHNLAIEEEPYQEPLAIEERIQKTYY